MTKNILIAVSGAVLLWGCTAHGDNPGREYAPNMYHSVAYEPLSQITDESAGRWVNSLDNGADRGEYFNSNKYNPNRMNMRLPAPNTVKRNKWGWLPYRSSKVAKDSIDIVVAASGLKNPFDSTAAIVEQGKMLYETNCKHCHGATGAGDGKVAAQEDPNMPVFPGVANLTGDSYVVMSEAHIFHVITYGAGLMASHGSQVSPDERWKIAKYVKVLQKKKK